MFGKQQNPEKKEEEKVIKSSTPPSQNPEVKDLNLLENVSKAIKSPWDESEEIELEIQDADQPEIVNIVEKISGILSPYFIVIVGLYLYDNNFFLGTLLIIIGIISLLKISFKDVKKWVEGIKKSLGYGQEEL